MTGPSRRLWNRGKSWSTASIRVRLLSGFTVLLVIGMAGSTATSTLLLRSFLNHRYQQTLLDDAARLREVLARGPQDADAQQLQTLLGAPLGIVAVGTDGTVLGSTGSAHARPADLVRTTEGRPDALVRFDPDDGDELIAIRITSPGLRITGDREPDGTTAPARAASALVLTIDTSLDDRTVDRLVLREALLVLGFLAGLAALAVGVLRVGLRPLRRMAETADAIAAGSMAQRLPVDHRPTETDGLARAVNRAFDAQARAEANARTFAADASHELRTPLATISGWLDLYHQGALAGPAIGDAVEHIDAEVGRMRLMVEELGLLARLDAGRPLDRQDVDLVSLAASVVEDAQVIDPDRDITLHASGDVHVPGDAPRLQQVLRNLVGNAVQHTPSGTAVQITVRPDGDRAVLTVSDNGPGIEPDHLPRVFERFWRAEASRSRAYGGSGLGLAIVQAIVQAHDGTVAVRSTTGPDESHGSGTTVVVQLPASTTPPPDRSTGRTST